MTNNQGVTRMNEPMFIRSTGREWLYDLFDIPYTQVVSEPIDLVDEIVKGSSLNTFEYAE